MKLPSFRPRNSRPNSPGSRKRLNAQRPAHCATKACSSTIQPSVAHAARAVAAPISAGELSMPNCDSVSAVRCSIGSSCAMTGASARTGITQQAVNREHEQARRDRQRLEHETEAAALLEARLPPIADGNSDDGRDRDRRPRAERAA